MTLPIRDLRYYLDGEIDVAGPVGIRIQHAAKQGNASHLSQKVRIAVHASDTFHKCCQSPFCRRTRQPFGGGCDRKCYARLADRPSVFLKLVFLKLPEKSFSGKSSREF